MGGTGTHPLESQFARLTPRERKVYDMACRLHRQGIYPSLDRISAELGYRNQGIPSFVRRQVIKKVGWPCPIERVKSGSHGLTQFERIVLTTAISLWEDLREYPSRERVALIMGKSPSSGSVWDAIKKLENLRLYPCKRKPYAPLTDSQNEFVVLRLRGGMKYRQICEEFRRTFRKILHSRQLSRIVTRYGLRRLNRRPAVVQSADVQKVQVISSRPPGFVLRVLDDPAAFRKAVRSARQGKISPGRPVSH
jgi:hypothetical protein